MKANLSPLRLTNFRVQSFLHKTMVPTTEEGNYELINIAAHSVDVDFEQFVQGSNLIVSMDLHVNKKKDWGYELKIESFGDFVLEESEDINEQMRQNLIGISTVNIMISNIRGYLKNVTAYGFLGPYLLPSLDVNSLLAAKRKQQLKKLKKKN